MTKQRLEILAKRVGRIFLYMITPVEKHRHQSSILICPHSTTEQSKCHHLGLIKKEVNDVTSSNSLKKSPVYSISLILFENVFFVIISVTLAPMHLEASARCWELQKHGIVQQSPFWVAQALLYLLHELFIVYAGHSW